MRSVLPANGARPFTFWASAISTSQPAKLQGVVHEAGGPFIDSITPRTGPMQREAGRPPAQLRSGRGDRQLGHRRPTLLEHTNIKPMT
jgi:hypothetical protein